MNKTQRLLQRTAARAMLATFGRHFHRAFLGTAALFLALVLASRLLGIIPDWFRLVSIAAVPGVALLIALAITRRPSNREAARLIDRGSGGKDLFLTAAMIEDAPGDFQPIVLEQAERRAAAIAPARIVPWPWQRNALHAAVAFGVLLACLQFLPHLDPFKKAARRERVAQQETRVREIRQAAALRTERLAEQSAKDSEQTRRALEQLDKTFKQAKPLEKEAALQDLAVQQKELGELWRKANDQRLRNQLEQAAQSFGQMDPKKLNAWREELKKGELSGLKKELAEIREQMKQLAAKGDSAEARAQREALAQRLSQLANALKQAAGSPQVNEALSRAMEQLELSKQAGLSREAMQGAAESLNLTEKELEELAKSLQNGKSLEDALKNLQMAKQLAAHGKLDGKDCKNCQGMGDYAALFEQKMGELAGMQFSDKSGMGPGIGNGAKRPENDAAKTGFQSEKSSSALAGGKLLLEWKTKEVGETGARTEQIRETVQQVRQGVSEAIQQEQVPPGYHDAIKRYFDTLPDKQ